jgi:formylglycine-generating enzyme required for sulfatase activity
MTMFTKPADAQHLDYSLGKLFLGSLISLTLLVSGCSPIDHGEIEIQPSRTAQATLTFTPLQTKTNTPSPTRTSIPSTQTAIPPTPTLGIGSTITGKDGMTLLYVPGSEFIMGSNNGSEDERPVHTLYLDAFWIDQTEVTNKMYVSCVDAGVCKESTDTSAPAHSSYYGDAEYDNYPVINVDWNMAKTYCEWMDRRLPTEAEWEKAARGTDQRAYPWGNDAPNNNLLNYYLTMQGGTTEVGRYPNGASPYGALDMAGNVWEWISSLFKPYPYSAADGREDLSASGARALRGGAWSLNGTNVRSANRDGNSPSYTEHLIGFRCAMSAVP